MRILIVSENFTNGGLETQILTQYEQMCKHHKFFFAFARYQQNEILPCDLIFDNFNFSVESTIKEFCSDVENLIKIIKENNMSIDLLKKACSKLILKLLNLNNIASSAIIFVEL